MVQSRGFVGRRGAANVRLPPGQYLTQDFPVLSAGPTPHVPLDQWELTIDDGPNLLRRWSWKSFRELPTENITVDIHCVTRWSKVGTAWEGVSLDTLLDGIADDASFALVRSMAGTRRTCRWRISGQAGVDRIPLRRRGSGAGTRRPCPAARPAPVLLEERQMGARHHAPGSRRARVLGAQWIPQLRRPMAGAAVLRRLKWHVCSVVALRDETATARTIALQVPDWPGHVAGQRVDIRVTAADGYSAVRQYSIASAPSADGRIELSVERLPDGEVSPYLTQDLAVGDSVELRGPIGGWFVWHEDQTEPIQLVAGGSGIVPLMAMIRSRAAAGSPAPFRLLYSVRTSGQRLVPR